MADNDVTCSMSRSGNVWDNAAMESFFSSLKTERIRGRVYRTKTYVFPGGVEDNPFGSFPNHWEKIFRNTTLADVTPHVLRHSFASVASDLGFTETTIAALIGHSRGTVTSKYIHTLDAALIMAADTISGYIE